MLTDGRIFLTGLFKNSERQSAGLAINFQRPRLVCNIFGYGGGSWGFNTHYILLTVTFWLVLYLIKYLNIVYTLYVGQVNCHVASPYSKLKYVMKTEDFRFLIIQFFSVQL